MIWSLPLAHLDDSSMQLCIRRQAIRFCCEPQQIREVAFDCAGTKRLHVDGSSLVETYERVPAYQTRPARMNYAQEPTSAKNRMPSSGIRLSSCQVLIPTTEDNRSWTAKPASNWIEPIVSRAGRYVVATTSPVALTRMKRAGFEAFIRNLPALARRRLCARWIGNAGDWQIRLHCGCQIVSSSHVFGLIDAALSHGRWP